MRLTYDEQTQRLVVHGPSGERDLSADEAQAVRDALEGKALPWWLDWSAVLLGIVALLVVARGGGS